MFEVLFKKSRKLISLPVLFGKVVIISGSVPHIPSIPRLASDRDHLPLRIICLGFFSIFFSGFEGSSSLEPEEKFRGQSSASPRAPFITYKEV